LLLRVPAIRITIGSLGPLRLAGGLYGYVGAARGGSVTLDHRLARHLRRRKVRRWHIDYLTTHPATTVRGAWVSTSDALNERQLACLCAQNFPVIPGFGNSDAGGGAPGHLFLLAPSSGAPGRRKLFAPNPLAQN
jgi:Uri superfamily endonuclease